MYSKYISTFNAQDLKVRKMSNYTKSSSFVNLSTTQNNIFKKILKNLN